MSSSHISTDGPAPTRAEWQPVLISRRRHIRVWIWDAHVGRTGFRYGWAFTRAMAQRKALVAVSRMVESGSHR